MITFLICARNEEKMLPKVLEKIPKDHKVIVVDNNSKDNTAKIAKQYGATVVFERRKGKGNAFRKGLKQVTKETEILIAIDADNQFDPREAYKLEKEILKGKDLVIGSRLQTKTGRKGLNTLGKIANTLHTLLTRALFLRSRVKDVASGFAAFNSKAIHVMQRDLTAKEFDLEIDIIAKAHKSKLIIDSIPVSCKKAKRKSHMNYFKNPGKQMYWLISKRIEAI